jgi:hypothetical protein
MLTPELLEALVERSQLRGRRRIVALRQLDVELGSALARAVDLLVNLFQRHTTFNVQELSRIPSARPAEEENEDDGSDHAGENGDRLEERLAHS